MGNTCFTLSPEEVFEHGCLPNIHPGEILKSEFLEDLGMTAYQLAKAVNVKQTRISEILRGKRGISVDTALRLARYFGTSVELWLDLQIRYDLRKAEDTLRNTLDSIQPRPVATL